MALLRRNKEQNSINILPRVTLENGLRIFSPTGRKYSDAYMMMIMKVIFNGLKNVRFTVVDDTMLGTKDEERLGKILAFFNDNADLIMFNLWSHGYVVFAYDKLGRLVMVDYSKLRTGVNGEILDYDMVYYSRTYQIERKSDFDVLRQSFCNIDTYKDAENYLTTSLGAFGILCGKGMPMSPAAKDELRDNLKRDIGISRTQYQLCFSQNEVELKQVDLHPQDLQLSQKVVEEIKLIAGYFGVPYDLVPFSGASTYANQEQAIVNFYRNCISPMAEEMLVMVQYIVKHSRTLITKKNISFTIDNVPELVDDRTANIEYRAKVAELVKTITDIGLDIPDDLIEKLNEN